MMKPVSALLVALLLAASCGGDALERAKAVVETSHGPITLEVELAETTDQRRRGLMGRTSLPERAGMLFVYPEPSSRGLWMKDTLIPLSVAYLDPGGTIIAILHMEPCLADPCAVYKPGVSYSGALEVNRGAFRRLGIAVGDRVRLAPS